MKGNLQELEVVKKLKRIDALEAASGIKMLSEEEAVGKYKRELGLE